jgi:hypothetical protein
MVIRSTEEYHTAVSPVSVDGMTKNRALYVIAPDELREFGLVQCFLGLGLHRKFASLPFSSRKDLAVHADGQHTHQRWV